MNNPVSSNFEHQSETHKHVHTEPTSNDLVVTASDLCECWRQNLACTC